MSAILLAPYNDSMRLGAGYNSFLQTPCVGNAVLIGDAPNTTKRPKDSKNGTSQTVAYSSSFVDKLSDVVRSMNISAGSSIRTGSVNSSSGNSSIDEAKFAESDLNAVLSVKVVNQTRTIQDKVTFNAVTMQNMNSDAFHSIYGDTFITGFIEGGDLHGIVSVKILEAGRKQEIKKQLKSQFNGAVSDWSSSAAGDLTSIMSQTEVTITVNYSGGGTIKKPTQEWTLESLMAAASAFPDNVSTCPQRTFAILSRYNTVPSFVEWMNTITPPIEVRRYESVQRYTSDLFDTFIEYKSNLLLLNNAIRQPELYQASSVPDALAVNLTAMVAERGILKAQMEEMVRRIERLDKNPNEIERILRENEIPAPELVRARFPVKKDLDAERAAKERKSLLEGLNLAQAPLGDAKPDSAASLKKDLELQAANDQFREEQKKNQDALAGLQNQLDQKTAESNGRADTISRHLATIKRLEGEVATTKTELATAETNYKAMKGLRDTAEQERKNAVEGHNLTQAELQQWKLDFSKKPEFEVISVLSCPGEWATEYKDDPTVKGAVWRHIEYKETGLKWSQVLEKDFHPNKRKWHRVIYQRRDRPVQYVNGWDDEYVNFNL